MFVVLPLNTVCVMYLIACLLNSADVTLNNKKMVQSILNNIYLTVFT